jgi:hypothetical protein
VAERSRSQPGREFAQPPENPVPERSRRDDFMMIRVTLWIPNCDFSSIAKAFHGELAEPNPNDELAEKLLKRILGENAKLEGGKKSAMKRKIKVQMDL